MEDFDGWIDSNTAPGPTGRAFTQEQGVTGLLGAASAWQSKRQRTLPAQPQHLQQDGTPAQLDQITTQYYTPENPTGHPTPISSQWISRLNHQRYHQHDQQQLHTQTTQPPYAPTAAAAPASAAAPAPIWHQKQRLPAQQQQQQQQQQTPPAHISSYQADQHTHSSQRYQGGSVGGASNWGDLWGEQNATDPAAGQQQQQQQRQHRQHMQQSDQLWGEDGGAAGQQQWQEHDWDHDQHHHQQQQQQQHLWGEEEDVWGCKDAAANADQGFGTDQQQQQQEEEGGKAEGEVDGEAGDEDQAGEEEEVEEEEVQLESAEFDLSRDEVIERIEQLAFDLISAAAAGQLPTLSCVSTARSNVHMAPRNSTLTTTASRLTQGSGASRYTQQGLGVAAGSQRFGRSSTGGVYAEDEDEEGLEGSVAAAAAAADGEEQQHVLRLGDKTQTKSLMANAGVQANSIVRALQLLDSVHTVLRSGRSSTQRDIYYNLVGRPGFQATRDVSSAIRSVLGMLRVPRSALGISAASKGAVAGCLLLRARPGEPWADCRSVGPSGRPIPGEVGAVDAIALRSAGARFILVVEKDAVFQSLVESRLHEQLPCILITGRGMPDVASRAFLAAVVEASKGWGSTAAAAAAGSFGGSGSLSSQWQQQQQSLPLLGLVDWNPGGVSILLAYKYGCAALGLESARYAVPSLSWLGVTSHMLQEGQVPQSRCHALSDRDRTLMPGLKARLANCPDWVQELEEMEGSGLKADIEALQHKELMRQVQQRVLQGSYLR